MAKLYGIDPGKVGGIGEVVGPRDEPCWVRLCVKTKEHSFANDATVFQDADSAAWHINKSTGKPTRVHAIGVATYAVDILLG